MTNTLLNKTKKDFVENAGTDKLPEKKTLRAPSRVKVFDPRNGLNKLDLNVALMGIPGVGKTEAIVDCLLRGLRVFMINTDAGGTGHETIVGRLREKGKSELLNNLVVLALYTYDDFREFCQKPESFYPGFYEFSPQVLAWEGFSNFQQNFVSEKTGEIYADTTNDVKESRAEGYRFEKQDWGVIRNATNSAHDDFLAIRVPGTENLLRIVTLHEAIASEQYKDSNNQVQTREVLSKRPFIQGAAKNLFSQGYCAVLRLTKKGKDFTYENKDDTLGFTKNRAIKLADSFPASFETVMQAIEDAYGIKIG